MSGRGTPSNGVFGGLSRRGFLKAAGLLLGQALVGQAADPPVGVDAPTVVWHGPRDLPAVAVTLDDCYSLDVLQALESVLSEAPELEVTLFPTGRGILNTSQRDSDLWSRLAARGVEFGYHGFDHERSSEVSVAAMDADFERWQEVLGQAVGNLPRIRFARPPYGERGYSFLELCRARRLAVAMWSTDWSGNRAEACRRVSTVRHGDIVLLHTRLQDIENLRVALAVLSDRPLCFVTLGRLLDLMAAAESSQTAPLGVCASPDKRGPAKPPEEAGRMR